MSDTLEQKKAQRFRFLNALYEKTGGNEHAHPSMWDIATELGISREDAGLIVQYLKGEYLLRFAAMGGHISITHPGVIEVERALSEPAQPTHYFPPVINILSIGSVQGSSIQQTGPQSTASASIAGGGTDALRALVSSLRGSIDELGQITGRLGELQGMVGTLEVQIGMASPNRTIVSEALKSVRAILEGATGSVLASHVTEQIKNWLG